MATVEGPLASILTAERTALNFLGHLSGIATFTRRFVVVAAAAGDTRIWDTRKTTPGLRSLEKAAVRAGGGANHRGNLSDWILLKDNHLARAGDRRRGRRGPAPLAGAHVHVECDRLDQVREALDAGCRRRPARQHVVPTRSTAAVAIADRAGRRPRADADPCSRSPVASPSRPSPATWRSAPT